MVICTRCEQVNEFSDEQLRHTNEPCSSCGFPLVLYDRYVAVKVIGRGGFGITFQALNWDLDCDCVIKCLRPQQRVDARGLQEIERRFREEARILHELRHDRIPQIYAYFLIQGLFFIVQDFIPGSDLAKELKQRSSPFLPEEVEKLLREILITLDYLHTEANEGRGVIHRDIKPANIIHHQRRGTYHLIDFGAIKRLPRHEEIASNSTVVPATHGYAPPEQMSESSKAIFDESSDLYALAATCIHLLTNQHPLDLRPDFLNTDTVWKQFTNPAAKHRRLLNILDKMWQVDKRNRYKSAKEVLKDLEVPLWQKFLIGIRSKCARTYNTLWGRFRWVVLLALFAFVLLATIVILPRAFPPPPEPSISEQISWGEKAFLSENQQNPNGVEEFKNGNFGDAIKKFQATISKNSNNPEVWIYLNNAIARQAKQNKGWSLLPFQRKESFYIVVALPKGEGKNPEEILRGIAHRQNLFNCGNITPDQPLSNFPALKDISQCQGNNGKFLEVGIAPYDDNSIDTTTEAILKLKREKSIVAVVGRYSSNHISRIGKLYASNQLVMIAPTSNARRSDLSLLPNTEPLDPKYIFRVMPDVSLMIREINRKMPPGQGLAIFRSQSVYGDSIIKTFQDLVNQPQASGGRQLLDLGSERDCQLSSKSSDINQSIKTCFSKKIINKVKTIVVAPDLGDIKVALEIMDYIYKNPSTDLMVYGSDTLYDWELLKQYNQSANSQSEEISKVLIAVPWTRETLDDDFLQISKLMWGNPSINWRTVMSFDAVQVLVHGLEKANYQREKLSTILSSKDFSTDGVTKEIKFENGDRKLRDDLNYFVKIVGRGRTGYSFSEE